jgi:hypothetical protein
VVELRFDPEAEVIDGCEAERVAIAGKVPGMLDL